MRIWSIVLAGAGLAFGANAPAVAGTSSAPLMDKSFSGQRPIRQGAMVHSWGPRHQGRWYAGWRAPGGWAAYRRPVAGYVLPRYWISPTYSIANYGAYGLPAPVSGYGWSRYYDDAVMTDSEGRVRDYRSDVRWDDEPTPGVPYDDEVTAPDTPPPASYEGRWSGTWRDRDGRAYSGDYEGRFEGQVHGGPGVDYDAPPYASAPHGPHRPGDPVVTTTQTPGYISGGYYYPGTTTTTVVVQPAVTTTRTYVTYRTVRRKVRGK